jgi:hypothetical protein
MEDLGGRRRRVASKAPLTDAAITDSIRYDFNEMQLPSLASARKVPGFKAAEARYRALRHEWDAAYHVMVKSGNSREARRDYKALKDNVGRAFNKLARLAKNKSRSRSVSRKSGRSRSRSRRSVSRKSGRSRSRSRRSVSKSRRSVSRSRRSVSRSRRSVSRSRRSGSKTRRSRSKSRRSGSKTRRSVRSKSGSKYYRAFVDLLKA